MATAQATQSSGQDSSSSKKLPPPSPLRSILAGSLAGGIEICESLYALFNSYLEKAWLAGEMKLGCCILC